MRSNRAVIAVAAMLAAAAAAATAADVTPLNLPAAVAAMQRLVERTTGDAGLYNDLGNLLYLAERLREAEDAYEQGLRIDPDSVSLRYNLALLLHQTDRPRRAENEYRKVLKRDPEYAWSHYQLGVLLARRGRRDSAIHSFARAMRLEPRLTDPAFNPHIVENSLASSSILWAYSNLSPAALAPRVYENPAHVTSILLAAQEGKRTPETKVERKLRREQRRRARQKPADG